jgi:hypothetical protein
MEFNATFNNIPVISWRLVLLVEETGGLGENQRPLSFNSGTTGSNTRAGTAYHSGTHEPEF